MSDSGDEVLEFHVDSHRDRHQLRKLKTFCEALFKMTNGTIVAEITREKLWEAHHHDSKTGDFKGLLLLPQYE